MSEAHPIEKVSPWRFSVLILPNAVLLNGLFAAALSALLRQQGVLPDRIGWELSIIGLPTFIYMLWGPLTDFCFRRRTWVVIGGVFGGALTSAAFLMHWLASTGAIVLLFLAAVCVQLLPAAIGGLMGLLKDDAAKRKASGYYQGFSLMSAALITGCVVLASQHTSVEIIGIVMGLLVAGLSLIALTIPEPEYSAHPDGFGKQMREVWQEFRQTIVRWKALPYVVMLSAPLASGALMGTMPGLAPDYGVNPTQVAWINGFGGGALLALGAWLVTLLPKTTHAPMAYIAVATLNALSLVFMVFGPLTPVSYFLSAPLYLMTTGAGYALFTAVLLEVMGRSGRSGSSRYSILNGLGNIPPVFMPALDGLGYALWKPRGMAAMDGGVALVACVAMFAWFLFVKRSPEDAATVS